MSSFQEFLQNNSAQSGVYALLTAAVVMLGFYVLRTLVLLRLTGVAKKTGTQIDDFFVDVLSATRYLSAVALGVYAALHFLTLPVPLEKVIDRVFIALVIVQVGLWANRGLIFWLQYRFSEGEDAEEGSRAMTTSLLTFLGRIALWTLVALLVLDNLGLNVTALVTSLGIGGIAVALALQNILGDIFASLSISIDKPFVIGDFIIVDDMMGTVEHVGLKTTRIRSLGGEQLILANNDLLKSRIRNYKRMQERRIVFSLGVTYDTPANQVEAIPALIRQAVEAQSATRFDRAHFKGFGPSSLDFETVYYVSDPDYGTYMSVQQAINLQLLRMFTQQGINFAFPTQTLHLAEGLPMEKLASKAEMPSVKPVQRASAA